MKLHTPLFCLLFVSFFASAQDALPKLSASALQYLWKLENERTERPYIFPNFVYRTDAQNKLYVNAIIKVENNFNEDKLSALGIFVNTKAGNIWTAQVPVENVRDFTRVSGIQYIEMDAPTAPLLDSARVAARVDSVHAGYGLPLPYSGKDVVVGIIDGGFDYTHPALYDTAYESYRVKKVWEEKTIGTPPAGFSYGSEYADSASIQAKGFDRDDNSHGAHVSGIAAGSGYGGDSTNARFRGMAYNSDLVFVTILPVREYWFNTGMADMLDGIHYIFDYAQSVSKPAVANLSWGCPLGPHDGNSLFSQALDNLTGSGKIFVLSAGNNGTNRIHLQKTFTPTDTLLNTFTTFSTYLPEKVNWIDVWGDSAQSFCIQFSLYNGNAKVDSTVFICLDNAVHPIALVGSDGDTCYITATAVASEFNGKPHILLDVLCKTENRLCITLTSTNGTVHLWQGYVLRSSGYYGAFFNQGFSWAITGDLTTQVSDMVTSRSAISVGAYNSKVSFRNVSGQNINYTGYTKGAIASFSSHGPTADGRTKPDITGPGMALASAVSSVDTPLQTGGAEYGLVAAKFVSPRNGKTYSYAMFQGTSMSSPSVSGIVALLLEANPYLTPQQVKDILAETAITDVRTGTIPTEGSNTWGFGKVNAYAAVKKALVTSGIFHEQSELPCLVYPNPNNGNYFVQYVSEKSETIQLTVYNTTGIELLKEEQQTVNGTNTFQLDLSAQPAGIYLMRINNASSSAVVRIVRK